MKKLFYLAAAITVMASCTSDNLVDSPNVAQNGEFRRFLDLKTLEKMLLDIYMPTSDDKDLLSIFKFRKGGKRDE